MDIKAKITEIVDKIKNDKSLLKNFKKDPTKTVKGLVGANIPDDTIAKIVEAVKSKVNVGKISGFFGKLFKKKKK